MNGCLQVRERLLCTAVWTIHGDYRLAREDQFYCSYLRLPCRS
ncbi:hypothetical protein GGP56_003429 [Salinibacter ruber]|nr:hypothetical protein [Salinibacter ruber]